MLIYLYLKRKLKAALPVVMNTRSVNFAVAIVLLLTAAAAARAQQGHTIRGKVHNAQGLSLSHVSVDLQTGTGSLISQTVTNNEGDFFFSELSGNSYLVIVSSPDYNGASERVDFVRKVGADEPGEIRLVDITLMPKSAPRAAAPGTTFVQDVPQAALTALTRALRLSKEGKGELALALMREALKIFPDYFDARFALGNEMVKAGRLGEAIAELEQARRINPKDARVYEAFGLVMMQQQKYAVAAAVFAEAARLNPLNPQPQLLRAMALIEYAAQLSSANATPDNAERNRALAEAENNLARAFELSGQKMLGVYLQRARIYEKRGELLRAAAELEHYLQANPVAVNAGEIRQAIRKLRAAGDAPKSSSQP
jgi:tetratricopeptide (TPR) repeat protein